MLGFTFPFLLVDAAIHCGLQRSFVGLCVFHFCWVDRRWIRSFESLLSLFLVCFSLLDWIVK
jgi:hypothetical protein